jgi:integrase
MSLGLWNRNGIWYARGRVHLPDGTSVAMNRSTKIEVAPGTKRFAERAAQRLVDELRAGGRRPTARRGAAQPDPARATVRDAADAYLRHRDVCADFAMLIESFAACFGSVRLGDLEEEALMVWARTGPRLQAEGREAAPRTVLGRIKAVRAVLGLAERRLGWPVPRLDLACSAPTTKTPKWLTLEERAALLAAFEPHWRPFATILFVTGARPVELGRLTWADVRSPIGHQACGRVFLRHLKGRSTGALHWHERDVPVARATLALLGEPGDPGAVVFRDPDGAPLVGQAGYGGRAELTARARAQIGAAFAEAAARAGLDERGITPYWARHTFASLLVQDNVPMQVVAELLGHTTSREVERTYGHLAPHQKEAAVVRAGVV